MTDKESVLAAKLEAAERERDELRNRLKSVERDRDTLNELLSMHNNATALERNELCDKLAAAERELAEWCNEGEDVVSACRRLAAQLVTEEKQSERFQAELQDSLVRLRAAQEDNKAKGARIAGLLHMIRHSRSESAASQETNTDLRAEQTAAAPAPKGRPRYTFEQACEEHIPARLWKDGKVPSSSAPAANPRVTLSAEQIALWQNAWWDGPFQAAKDKLCNQALAALDLRDRLAAANDLLREASATLKEEAATHGHGHWDKKGTHGTNCPLCIAQRNAHGWDSAAKIDAYIAGVKVAKE